MIPKKFAPVLFGFILSGLMSLLVSGIATYRAISLSQDFFGMWSTAWLTSWMVSFPVVLVVGPIARKIVSAVTLRD